MTESGVIIWNSSLALLIGSILRQRLRSGFPGAGGLRGFACVVLVRKQGQSWSIAIT